MNKKQRKARAKRRSVVYANERVLHALANIDKTIMSNNRGRLTHGSQWNFSKYHGK